MTVWFHSGLALLPPCLVLLLFSALVGGGGGKSWGREEGEEVGGHQSEKQLFTDAPELLATSGTPPRCRESNDRVEQGTRLGDCQGEKMDVMHTVWMFVCFGVVVFFFKIHVHGQQGTMLGVCCKKVHQIVGNLSLLQSV